MKQQAGEQLNGRLREAEEEANRRLAQAREDADSRLKRSESDAQSRLLQAEQARAAAERRIESLSADLVDARAATEREKEAGRQ